MFKTSNPTLNPETFQSSYVADKDEYMTLQGTTTKTLLLLALCFAAASIVWNQYFSGINPHAIQSWTLIGGIGGFIASLITIFKKQWAPVTAIIYAGFEGLFLGGLSATLEYQYSGVAIQAVGFTFATLVSMILLYRSGLITINQRFVAIITTATGTIALLYLLSMVLSFFHISLPLTYGNSTLAIVFSGLVIITAAFNLLLDFELIAQGEIRRAAKYMEWYGAFSLMVTLVWLYIEFLRLIVRLRSRKN